MFDELFGELESSLTGFFESDVFQIGVRVLLIYVVLIWLAAAFWAYRDMRQRTESAVAPYVAAAAIIVFTPIFFLFALLLYRIVRPKETIAEVNDRALAEEAMLSEIASHAHCANCSRPVHEDWIICPTCRNRLRRVCPNCEHLIELDWTLCAWCGKDFDRAEAPGTAPFMPTARPAPRRQPPPPTAPPPARVPPPPAPATGSGKPAPAGTSASVSSASSRGSASGSSTPPPPTKPQGQTTQATSGSSSAAPTPPPTMPGSSARPATGER